MSILGFFTILFLIVCAVILAEMYREQQFFLRNTLRSTFTKDNLHSRKRLGEQNYFFK